MTLRNTTCRVLSCRYGAFWCSHCFDQKQAFGKDAMADFPYVECYPDGFRKVRSTWFSIDESGFRVVRKRGC